MTTIQKTAWWNMLVLVLATFSTIDLCTMVFASIWYQTGLMPMHQFFVAAWRTEGVLLLLTLIFSKKASKLWQVLQAGLAWGALTTSFAAGAAIVVGSGWMMYQCSIFAHH